MHLSSTRLLGPVVTMTDYEPVRHPKLSELRRRALLAMRGLERFASHDPDGGVWCVQSEEDNAASEESWLIAVQTLRRFRTELESGLAIARFVREVRRNARDLAPRLESAIAGALANACELLAFAAVMAGTEDDLELGIEVIPPPHEGSGGGVGSVEFDW